jgi:hypothetical protein
MPPGMLTPQEPRPRGIQVPEDAELLSRGATRGVLDITVRNRCCRQRVTAAGPEPGYLACKGDAEPALAAGRVSRRGFRRRGLG